METFKELARSLWKDKPVLIAVVAAIAFLIYMYWKSNQAKNQAQLDAASTQQAIPVATGSMTELSYYYNAPITYNYPAKPPVVNPPPVPKPPVPKPPIKQPPDQDWRWDADHDRMIRQAVASSVVKRP